MSMCMRFPLRGLIMKLSEAIKELEIAIKEHGDIELRHTDGYNQQYISTMLSFGTGDEYDYCGGGDYCEFES